MPFEDARSHFDDILESIRMIEEFVQQMDLATFRLDQKTQAAVERKMLVISEAAIRLTARGESQVLKGHDFSRAVTSWESMGL